MMVMPADYDAPTVGYWAAKYPNKIGWLVGPTSRRIRNIPEWMPFACDNDRFIAWKNNTEWSESAWLKMLSFLVQTNRKPRWVLVPDVVGDKCSTLEAWDKFSPVVASRGFPMAFAVQDGMTPQDVPSSAEVVFIGGTTEWKWRNVRVFCSAFPRVHVGRVGTPDRVWMCDDAGAESIDGTGWFRDGELAHRFQRLEQYFKGDRVAELNL